MRFFRAVDTVSGPPSLVRQRQAGRQAPSPLSCLPYGAVDVGSAGSAGAVLAGEVPTTRCRGCHQPWPDPEHLKRARLHVKRAIKEKKIFVVQGPYPIIRSLLWARGWVEKKLPRASRRPEQHPGTQKKQLQEEKDDEESDGDDSEQGEAVPFLGTSEPLCPPWPPDEEEEEVEEEQCDEEPDGIHELMSQLVQDQVPYFIWTNHCRAVDYKQLQQDQVVNHYAGVSAFTTKEGLCLNLRNLPWYNQADPDTFFPRCYRLGSADERQAFIEDFRLTAARSLLKVALERAEDAPAGMEQPPKCDEGPAGQRPPLAPHLVEEALQLCRQHLGTLRHQDIDRNTPSPRTAGTDWDRFLQDCYCVLREGAVPVLSGAQREQSQALLQHMAGQLPQLDMEGHHNIWILKPAAQSCGRGIICTAQLEEVLRLAGNFKSPSAWVVQKYVERPLLIFGTKFDIRQWFLVTNWTPLTVWFYRESYLRFCSRPFSLRHLDAARHLCNVSIQRHFHSARGRHPQLPPDQIWSCWQFQAYLAQVGQAGAWQQVMEPGMKAAVVGVLCSAQDLVGPRKGSFELYGADFVFGEDCQPWLLEINASPTMAPSSAVTRSLCARVQRDTLRVVIDHRDDPSCPTGAFELIYKEAAVPQPRFSGLKLMVKGSSLRKPQRAQQRSHCQPCPSLPSFSQRPGPRSSWGKANPVPALGASRRKLAPLRPKSRCCSPSTAPRAPPQPPGCPAESGGLPQLSCLPGQPQAALPWLIVRPLARLSVQPPQGAPASSPRGPAGQAPSCQGAVPTRHLDPMARPKAAKPPAGRKPVVAPGRKQKSHDTKGNQGVDSILPIPARAIRWHPVPLQPSWAPSLGWGTQPLPPGGCKTCL
ncbi:tubulin monoglycylase TTLL3 [Apus apus]|uniref:tubulin monoglycylase TTLL3 n=1 Tax=Apus apus TaxID=8895 RepID=UPI0021F87D87|nr:tubulin monoglycylase TTLL3 [Apus apus]